MSLTIASRVHRREGLSAAGLAVSVCAWLLLAPPAYTPVGRHNHRSRCRRNWRRSARCDG